MFWYECGIGESLEKEPVTSGANMGAEEEGVVVVFICHMGCACDSGPQAPRCVTQSSAGSLQSHRARLVPRSGRYMLQLCRH